MNFSDALNLIKNGVRVTRAGWNGKNMWIFLVDGAEYSIHCWSAPEGENNTPFIAIKTIDAVVPWVASQTDLLAEDWAKVELKD